MPLPKFQPASGNLGAAQPIVDEVGNAYNRGVNFLEHPIDSIKGVLGIPLGGPEPRGADPAAVQRANESFSRAQGKPMPPKVR